METIFQIFSVTTNGSFGFNSTPELTTANTIVGKHTIMLKTALDVIVIVYLTSVMLAMGSDVNWIDLKKHLRRPTGIIIGMTSQFAILPFCAFIIAKSLQLSLYESLSLLVLSCCPGGVVSNLYTMWCDGNVSLSICMTTINTTIALGMMPLNLLLYTTLISGGYEEKIVVPYDKLALTLVMILIPVLIGTTIKTKCPKIAPWVMRGCTVVVVLSIISGSVIQIILFPDLFECNWTTYFSALMLPFLGFCFGFIWSRILKLSHRDSRTVAMETSAQNVSLTITVLSFPLERLREMAPIPMIFAIFVHIEAVIMCLVYHCFIKRPPAPELIKNINEPSVENTL